MNFSLSVEITGNYITFVYINGLNLIPCSLSSLHFTFPIEKTRLSAFDCHPCCRTLKKN